MNLSANYYNNQTLELQKLNNQMDMELNKLYVSIIEDAPTDDVLAFEIYMMTHKGEYIIKSNNIIDTYTKRMIRASDVAIRDSGELFGFGWDGQYKRWLDTGESKEDVEEGEL